MVLYMYAVKSLRGYKESSNFLCTLPQSRQFGSLTAEEKWVQIHLYAKSNDLDK